LIEEGPCRNAARSFIFWELIENESYKCYTKNVCNVSFIILYDADLLEKIRGE